MFLPLQGDPAFPTELGLCFLKEQGGNFESTHKFIQAL